MQRDKPVEFVGSQERSLKLRHTGADGGLTHICDKNCNQRILYDNHSSLCRVSGHIFPLTSLEEQAVRGVRRKLGAENSQNETCILKRRRDVQFHPSPFEKSFSAVGPICVLAILEKRPASHWVKRCQVSSRSFMHDHGTTLTEALGGRIAQRGLDLGILIKYEPWSLKQETEFGLMRLQLDLLIAPIRFMKVFGGASWTCLKLLREASITRLPRNSEMRLSWYKLPEIDT
ncbi:hypothetical protein RJ641_032833 [Dillenia turbinata]|uniref:Uncharacterized protein n=1 Tax=Dillenia turbinata TaxID=194707 RepID=A0AAN8VX58_9MAGN